MTRGKPLAGLRVADFCWIGAGSYTTKILADLGADVIKIESSARLDSLRNARPFAGGEKGVNRSGYFADRNTSKRSVTINLKTDRGKTVARELVLASDVVTNNFTPGTLDRLGLGYDVIRSERPDVVFVEMSMQGATGPARDYMGYGAMIAAMCGFSTLTAEPGGLPLGTGTNYPDHVPNPCHAAFAILAALRHRRRTGEGQYIDIAQTEPTLAMLGPAYMAAAAGQAPAAEGNQHLASAPHGVYPTKGEDRWIAIAARDQGEWMSLISVLGADALGKDPRFARAESRLVHAAALDDAVGVFTRAFTADDLMAALQAQGVPAGTVRDAEGVVDADPQLASRGHWVRFDHPEMGRTIYNAPPFRFADDPVGLRSRAPLLGEHTEEVCRDILSMTPDEIAELQDTGVLC